MVHSRKEVKLPYIAALHVMNVITDTCLKCGAVGKRQCATECPGKSVDDVRLDEIADGILDFFHGKWWRIE